MNGDGLPDHVRLRPDGGQMRLDIRLNLGHSLGAVTSVLYRDWVVPSGPVHGRLEQDGTTTTNFQGSYQRLGGGPISTTTFGSERLIDLNGDGRPDRLLHQPGGHYLVMFNLGNGEFSEQADWAAPSWPISAWPGSVADPALTSTVSVGANISGGPGTRIPVTPWVCVMLSLALHADTALSSGSLGFQDMDGDGHVDHVLRMPNSTHTYVRLNRTGKANLLRRVNRPLGGFIELDYSRQGNLVTTPAAGATSDTQRGPDSNAALPVVMPNSQWALTSVTVNDGSGLHPADGHQLRTLFEYYDSGFYDRAERENYGYSHIRTTLPDLSYTDAYFYNQDYWKRGLPGRTEEHAGTAGNRKLRLTTHQYTPYPVTAVGGAVIPSAKFPAETSSSSTLYGVAIPGTDPPPELTTHQSREYAHPETGNPEWVLSSIIDDGDVGSSRDNITYTLGYFVGTGARCIRVNSITAAPTASPIPGLNLPERRAAYAPSCFLTSVTDVVTGPLPTHFLTTTITPDAFGNVLRVTEPNGYWVEYERDPVLHQFILGTTDAFDSHSMAVWDYGFGVQVTIRDANLQKQGFAYDEFGRVIAVYAPGDPDTGIPANDATVTFAYTLPFAPTPFPAGATTHHRSLPGETPINTYTHMDGFGRVIQTARDVEVDVGGSPGLAVTVSGAVLYDPLGRPIEQGHPVQRPSGSGGFFVPVPMINPTTQRFDEWGRADRTTFPDGNTTTSVHTVEIADPANTAGTNRWMRVASTDQLGRLHETFTDAAGRTLRVTQRNHIGSADYSSPTAVTPITTNYSYDALGRLSAVLDAATNTTSVEYDSLGRRTSIQSPDTGLSQYVYDTAGNLAKRITPNLHLQGATIQNNYLNGRLMRIDYPDLLVDGAWVAQAPTIFTYGSSTPGPDNTVGRIASRRDASGVTTFQYGSLGETTHTTQELVDPADPTSPLTPVGPYDTRYSYDRFGRMRDVTYPNGEIVYYRYDAGGALNRVDYDRDGEPGSYVLSVLYDHFGQRTQITYGNHVVSRFTYTPDMRRLNTLATDTIAAYHGGPRSVTAQNVTYSYTPTGNISMTVNSAAGPGSGGTVGWMFQAYHYDALDQLRHSAGSYQLPTASGLQEHQYVSNFQYDELGRMARNQQNETTLLGGVVASSSDRELAYTFPTGPTAPVHAPASIKDYGSGGQTTIYHWDQNGNQTGSEVDGVPGSRAMQWDHENRVVQFTQHSGTGVPDAITRFVYDAGGTRTHKVSASEGTLTVYPNQFTSVRRLNAAGEPAPYFDLTTNHVYAGEERVASHVISSAITTKYETYWYHGDHLTSTNWVTNSAGVITEHLEYYPFGETWVEEAGSGSTSPGTPEAYRYTAKELDSETGLYYFGARYYDPRIALWASADPILASYLGGSPNGGVWNPANLVLYSYSFNSPVLLRDPDGLFPPAVGPAVPAALAVGRGLAAGTGAGGAALEHRSV